MSKLVISISWRGLSFRVERPKQLEDYRQTTDHLIYHALMGSDCYCPPTNNKGEER